MFFRRQSIRQQLTQLVTVQVAMLQEMKLMSSTLVNLQNADLALADAVSKNISDSGAVLVELKDLADQVAALKNNSLDPAAVDAISSDLQAKVQLLQQNNSALEAALVPPQTAGGTSTTTDSGQTDGSTSTGQ